MADEDWAQAQEQMRAARREYNRLRRLNDPEFLARERQRIQQWQRDHPENTRDRNRRSRLKLRRETLEAYGGVCQCCGEDDERFLTLDHVNNDGATEREQLGIKRGGDTIALFRRLRTAGWPEGYQVLCWNCNCGRHLNGGVCPHQDP